MTSATMRLRSRSMRGTIAGALAGGLLSVSTVLLPTSGFAQDIEALARMRGLPLPQSYYELVARDTTAFTLSNGLFRVTADGSRIPAALGTKRLAVIPALFSDSPEPHVSEALIQQAIFDGPAPRGTLTEAYLEMSGGLLEVTGVVTPWVRTSLPLDTVVGSTQGLGGDSRVGDFLAEALALADPDIDFGLYDNDGPDGVPNSGDDDGIVDAVAFEFLEVAGSCGGPGIWPHLWAISPQREEGPYETGELGPDGEPILVNSYIIQSAVDCGGVEVQNAGTIAHEFGHVLGLPDYYHPTADGGAAGRRWVLGCWELMAAGSWGCGPVGSNREPFGPSHMSARSKFELGWLDWVDPGEVRNEEIVLAPVQQSRQALRMPLDNQEREFLIVEFRTKTGFDHQIPADGVLVYHQDLFGALRPDPSSTTPYFLTLLEQDGNDGLVRNSFEGGNRGEAGDAWGALGVSNKLHSLTTPGSRRHTGANSAVTLHSVVVDGEEARIVLSTARSPELVEPAGPIEVMLAADFDVRLRVAGGFMPYWTASALPDGISARGDGDELVLQGYLTQEGSVHVTLEVTDAHQSTSPPMVVTLTTTPWSTTEERLVQQFLGSSTQPLGEGERTYLDSVGNGNGRYDIGDLRAWLRSGAQGH